MSDFAILDYRPPHERALLTLRRQLIFDAATIAVAVIATIPAEGPVNWRVVALCAAAAANKTILTTLAKYERAVRDDRTAAEGHEE